MAATSGGYKFGNWLAGIHVVGIGVGLGGPDTVPRPREGTHARTKRSTMAVTIRVENTVRFNISPPIQLQRSERFAWTARISSEVWWLERAWWWWGYVFVCCRDLDVQFHRDVTTPGTYHIADVHTRVYQDA